MSFTQRNALSIWVNKWIRRESLLNLQNNDLYFCCIFVTLISLWVNNIYYYHCAI